MHSSAARGRGATDAGAVTHVDALLCSLPRQVCARGQGSGGHPLAADDGTLPLLFLSLFVPLAPGECTLLLIKMKSLDKAFALTLTIVKKTDDR